MNDTCAYCERKRSAICHKCGKVICRYHRLPVGRLNSECRAHWGKGATPKQDA